MEAVAAPVVVAAAAMVKVRTVAIIYKNDEPFGDRSV